jgi:hypothetical protein
MTRVSPYQEDDASRLAGEVFGGNLSIEEALTELRTRLLDLSMRNRLLNYRLPKGRSLQFTGNPDLDQIYEHLQDGKSVALAYVPDPPPRAYEARKKPEARQYAKVVDISTSVDIVAPAQRAASTRVQALQTLFYTTQWLRGQLAPPCGPRAWKRGSIRKSWPTRPASNDPTLARLSAANTCRPWAWSSRWKRPSVSVPTIWFVKPRPHSQMSVLRRNTWHSKSDIVVDAAALRWTRGVNQDQRRGIAKCLYAGVTQAR